MPSPFYTGITSILEALKQRFGIDAHYFAKTSSIVLMSHGINVLQGIVSGYLVARLFPREMYGEYQFVMTAIGALAGFSIPEMTTAIARAAARKEDGIIRFTFLRYLLLSSLGSVVLLCSIPLLKFWGRESLWPLVAVAAFLFPLLRTANAFFSGLTVGGERFTLRLYTTMGSSLLLLTGSLLVLLIRPSSFWMVVVVMSIPALIYAIPLVWLLPRSVPEKRDWSILKYGFTLMLIRLPVSFAWYIDKLLVASFFGLNQLAVFSVALMIPEQSKILARELLPVSFARQAVGPDSRERRRKVLRVTLWLTGLFGLLILLYIAAAPFFFPLLFPNYPDAILLTQVAAAIMITVPSSLATQYLEAQSLIRALRTANIIASATLFLALVTLVPTLGPLGALLARGSFRLAYAGTTVYYLLRSP